MSLDGVEKSVRTRLGLGVGLE